MAFYDYGWRPYVPVAERRRKALREMEKRRKKGHAISPVTVEGRTIARTFWLPTFRCPASMAWN